MMPRAVAFVGWSGSGKTTLLCALLAPLREHFPRIAVVKHSHHDGPFREGGDTAAFLHAGADTVIFAAQSQYRDASNLAAPPRSFDRAEEIVEAIEADLVVIEGFKDVSAWPRVLVHRDGTAPAIRFVDAAAIVHDGPTIDSDVMQFSFEATTELAAFIATITAS